MPHAIRKFARGDVTTWHQMEDGKQITGAQVVHESHGRAMGVAFWRLAAGESADIPVPYDEVWVVTSGAVAIHVAGDVITARSGELFYIPANAPGYAEAMEDTELVAVSHPPQPLWD